MEDTFGALDMAVFCAALVISFSIGIFFALWDRIKKRTSAEDYFHAGRRSNTLPVAMSFVVSFQSSLFLLAGPVEVYAYGMVYCYNIVGLFLSYLFAAFVIVPVFHPLKITSVSKYFHLRYDGDHLLRYLFVATSIVYTLFYMGTVIYATCIALKVVVGIPYWGTVLTYTVLTTIYTAVGGIKAVIWTDVFQMSIMIIGMLSVLIKSTVDTGGATLVTRLARDQLNKLGQFTFDPTIRYTFWNNSFGTFTIFLYYCFTQSGIQRINSTRNIRSARLVYILAAPMYALFNFMAAYQGMTIFAYHSSKGCDIYNSGLIDNINEIVPVTVLQLFQNIPVMTGLFIASLSSAALSTLSSCLNSLSAITYDDIIRVISPDITERRATQLSKMAVLLYGLASMAMSFMISKLPGSVSSIFDGFMGCLDGPTVAMFLLSIFFRRASSKGVFIGSLCGMIISFWLIMGKTFSGIPADPKIPSGPVDRCTIYENNSFVSAYKYTQYSSHLNDTLNSSILDSPRELSVIENIYTISYILFSLIGCLVSLLLGVLFSLLTKPPNNVNEKYLFRLKQTTNGTATDETGGPHAEMFDVGVNDTIDDADDANEQCKLTNFKHTSL